MAIPNRIGMNTAQLKTEPINIIDNMNVVEFDIYCARMYLSKLDSCKSRNIPFKLNLTSFKNLMKAKKCYYTGVKLVRGTAFEGHECYLTIDRIDNKLPYQKGNVVACSLRANQLKCMIESSDFTMTDALNVFKKTIKRGVK